MSSLDQAQSAYEQAFRLLDEDQRRATLADIESPCLVVAGPGSGKTRVLTLRIAMMILKCRIPAHSILALTFTRKACQEMQDRVAKLCCGRDCGLMIQTFHSYCLACVKECYAELGFRFEPMLLDSSAQIDLVKECFGKLNSFQTQQIKAWRADNRIDSDYGDEELNQVPSSSNADKGTHQAALYFVEWMRRNNSSGSAPKPQFALESEVFGHYEREKKRRNCVDFDDLIPLAISLLENSRAKESIQAKTRYILVDEYQDVSNNQIHLLKVLMRGKQSSITAFGDPNQSIYNFLHCKVQDNFGTFLRTWTSTNVMRLDRNFRSCRCIVEASTSLISNNSTQGTEYGIQPYTTNDVGDRIVITSHAAEEKEVAWVVNEIEYWRQTGIPLSQMAILYRLRSIGKAFENALKKKNIPVVNASPENEMIYRKALSIDLIAYLKVALFENDDAVRRIINKPKRGLGESAVGKVITTAQKHKCKLLQACRILCQSNYESLPQKQTKGLSNFLHVIQSIQHDIKHQKESIVLENLQRHIFGSQSKHDNELEKIIQHMQKDVLLETDDFGLNSKRRTSVSNETSSKLCSFISMVGNSQIKAARQREVVTLTTIHQSKGLEFSHVWLVRFADSICPLLQRIEDDPDDGEAESQSRTMSLEEERRLAYVAFSRAKSMLQVSWVSRDSETGLNQEPSRFLQEIPERYKQGGKEMISTRNGANNVRSAPITQTPTVVRKSSELPGSTSSSSVQNSEKFDTPASLSAVSGEIGDQENCMQSKLQDKSWTPDHTPRHRWSGGSTSESLSTFFDPVETSESGLNTAPWTGGINTARALLREREEAVFASPSHRRTSFSANFPQALEGLREVDVSTPPTVKLQGNVNSHQAIDLIPSLFGSKRKDPETLLASPTGSNVSNASGSRRKKLLSFR
eukprot:754593-Hanusia_phi.AAC.1